MVGSEGSAERGCRSERSSLIHRRLDHSCSDGDDAAAEGLPSMCETLGLLLSINTMYI